MYMYAFMHVFNTVHQDLGEDIRLIFVWGSQCWGQAPWHSSIQPDCVLYYGISGKYLPFYSLYATSFLSMGQGWWDLPGSLQIIPGGGLLWAGWKRFPSGLVCIWENTFLIPGSQQSALGHPLFCMVQLVLWPILMRQLLCGFASASWSG